MYNCVPETCQLCVCSVSQSGPTLCDAMDCETLWTVALQAPLSMGFPRQEYWSELPLPPLGIFPTQGLNPHVLCFLYWQADSLPLVPPGKPLYSIIYIYIKKKERF